MFMFDILFTVLGFLLPFIVTPAVVLLAVLAGPRLIGRWRQRAYDELSAAEAVRLTITPPAGLPPDADLATELIRAVHPRQRRGFGPWRVGWPLVELSVVGRGGEMTWEVTVNRQVAVQIEHGLRALYPNAEVSVSHPEPQAATATAVGRLAAGSEWPLGEAGAAGGGALNRLAAAIEQVPESVEVRLRIMARPLSAQAWRQAIPSPDRPRSVGMGQLVGSALVQGVLFTSSTSSRPVQPPGVPLEEREARARKRRGVVGFDVGLLLEVDGAPADEAETILWRLVDFTHPLADGYQEIRWQIRRGMVSRPPLARLADWELAQLWYLPDASFDQAGFVRDRPLAAPAARDADDYGLVIGDSRGRPLAIPIRTLPRHLAVLGATGSGKSTLLLNLALGAIQAGIGTTVIDPHGDLVRDVASRVPRRAFDHIHVLRLADREHPRGFNFLERRQPGDDQLVASEFVYMLEDLWPRFCGPKMQHYLRHALLTLLADDRPQTILELVRILTDDRFRQQFLPQLRDPMVRAFWATQWPGGAERDRDASIKAVLNKLGAFVTYDSIRAVIGQGTSTIRPRDIMDRGEVLLVDLSGVGGDNATLFGAMLVSRFYVDALGRQSMDPADRRQHLLIIDEAQRFGTRAVENIAVEGRKFGLALALASQSLAGMGERLSRTVVTNAATIALLAPGAEDVRNLARLFAPVTAEQLTSLRAFETVVRMPGRDGRPTAVGGILHPPGPADPELAAEVIAASDARDARPLAEVQDGVLRRAGGLPEGTVREARGPAKR